MLTGVIGVGGVDSEEQIAALVEHGLLDKVVQFINRDPRVNLSIESLIVDKIHSGFISFVVMPTSASSKIAANNRKAVVAISEDPEKVQKVCREFFSKFHVGKDLSDFNVNEANTELYNLLEKVALNLNNLEKKRIMRAVQAKLAEHNIKLIYLENNMF